MSACISRMCWLKSATTWVYVKFIDVKIHLCYDCLIVKLLSYYDRGFIFGIYLLYFFLFRIFFSFRNIYIHVNIPADSKWSTWSRGRFVDTEMYLWDLSFIFFFISYFFFVPEHLHPCKHSGRLEMEYMVSRAVCRYGDVSLGFIFYIFFYFVFFFRSGTFTSM